jgi:molybdopterin-containing oxidoreductase family membrane subunit
MSDDRVTLLGLFTSEAQAAAAIAEIMEMRGTDFVLEQVHSPIPSHVISDALQQPKSKVGWYTLVGAVIGFFCGFWLAAFTASRWDLVVGGKPVFAWIPFVIVGFEFTILFAVFGNVVGLISQARLPRLAGQSPYHPRVSGDHFGLAASCPADDFPALERFFQRMGADIVPAAGKEADHR